MSMRQEAGTKNRWKVAWIDICATISGQNIVSTLSYLIQGFRVAALELRDLTDIARG
jgi:hypothetical protein